MELENQIQTTRIQQIWIIISNGICAIHWLYSGKTMDENLFAAFVRALFSFSQDMAETNIRNMGFGNQDIHYLPGANDQIFVAISSDQGTSKIEIENYLAWIAQRFASLQANYIEKMPPFDPPTFKLFYESVDKYISYQERIELGNDDFSLPNPIESMKYSDALVAVKCISDNLIYIYSKSPFQLVDIIYPETGRIKEYYIQKSGAFLVILSDTSQITIRPINLSDDNPIKYQTINIEEYSVEWCSVHPTQNLIIGGNNDNIFSYNLLKGSKIDLTTNYTIKEFIIFSTDKLIVLTQDGELLESSFPLSTEKNFTNISDFNKPIANITLSSREQLILLFEDGSIAVWNTIDSPSYFKAKYPPNSRIGFDESRNFTFVLTEFQELSIHTEDGKLLINYNLISPGFGCCINENEQIILFYENGQIKPFAGTFNKKEIQLTHETLNRRINSVENHILRISNGVSKFLDDTNIPNRNASEILADIKQVGVYKQQLKRIIDKRLLERSSILRDMYIKLQGYQTQIDNFIPMIDDLFKLLERQYELAKDQELTGKSPSERVITFINNMKAREQISISSLANEISLSYDEVIQNLQMLEGNSLLPGWLTRSSNLSIRDNILFVKRDPKLYSDLDSNDITSF